MCQLFTLWIVRARTFHCLERVYFAPPKQRAPHKVGPNPRGLGLPHRAQRAQSEPHADGRDRHELRPLARLHVILALRRLSADQTVQTVAIDLGCERASSLVTMFRKMVGEPLSAKGSLTRDPAAGQAAAGFVSTK
jgi:hypothetical protein